MLYTSAEIPPAGAPSGFDSAAFFDFIACDFQYLCRSAQNDRKADCCVRDTIFIRLSQQLTSYHFYPVAEIEARRQAAATSCRRQNPAGRDFARSSRK